MSDQSNSLKKPSIDDTEYEFHSEFQSLGDLLEARFEQFANRESYWGMGRSLKYRELNGLSGKVASWLQQQGLKEGERVALMLPNILVMPVSMFGALRAGCTVTSINPLYTPREVQRQLVDSGARVIITMSVFVQVVQQAIVDIKQPLQVVIAEPGDLAGFQGYIANFAVRYIKKLVPAFKINGSVTFKEVLSRGSSRPATKVSLSLSDVAFLQYTGGTTGIAKGAVITHGNLLANIAQITDRVFQGGAFAAEPQRIVTAVPLYHAIGLLTCTMMMLQIGGSCLLVPNPRDLNAFTKILRLQTFTMMAGVNTLYQAIMAHADFGTIDFSKLVLCGSGGTKTLEDVAVRWHENTGCQLTEVYGMSEATAAITFEDPHSKSRSGTAGQPVKWTKVEVRLMSGAVAPADKVGDIYVRGPQIMAAYWNQPFETANSFDKDGYLNTGDMGYLDSLGRLTLVDRKKDMILVSGFNVYPTEIEEVLAQHPAVSEVAAIGVPDPHSSEAPAVFIVQKSDELKESDVMQICREQLTPYKCPKHVRFVSSLPKSPVGKILRRELRDQWQA
jgi:long-chain acyl-CoA synthetase